MEGAIFGIGNPLLDIAATVPEEVFTKYDVKPNNAILAEEKHMPLYAELASKFKVEYIAGGATQNSIRVAQWMIQEPKQATSFVGAVGKDNFGAQLEQSASGDNVNVHYMKVDEPTGTCAVLIDDNSERSLVANISAAGKYDISHLQQADTQALIAKARVFYMAGFFLTVSPPAALEVAKHAQAENKIFCMNLSAPFICQFFTEPLTSLLAYTNFLFGNESEAVAFAESQKWDTKDIAEIAKRAAAMDCAEGAKRSRVVVITQGADSTVVATSDGVTSYPVTPIAKSEIVDSNGAGDAFVGGFLSQLVAGKSIATAVEAGHYAAGVIIRRSSCSFPPKPDFKSSA